MNCQTVLQFVTAVAATLGINAIPAGLVLWDGAPAATACVLYFLETWVAMILIAARVRILAPRNDHAYAALGALPLRIGNRTGHSPIRYLVRNRRTLILNYAIPAFAFLFVLGLFLLPMLFLVKGHATIPGPGILSGMQWIIAIQFVHFLADLLLLGRLTPAQAENLLKHGFSRVTIIFLAVFIGLFLGAAKISWFVIPFVVLKTTSDLGVTIQFLGSHVKLSRAGDERQNTPC